MAEMWLYNRLYIHWLGLPCYTKKENAVEVTTKQNGQKCSMLKAAALSGPTLV